MGKTYRTKSLNISAYLSAKGVELIKTDSTNPREIFWEFSNPRLCQELINEYWKDKALVNPKRLFGKLNELRDMLSALRS